jgi:GT2 family glycosyltransferase
MIPTELSRLTRRGLEILRHEGPEGLWARLQRRLSSDQRKILARYPAWVAHEERTRPAPSTRLISIVTPVKDPPLDVFRATARSVLSQSGAVEWCVADDGSREEVRRELAALAARDRRVHVTLLESSRGISGATNAGLALAQGELVGFLDHDDLLHEDAASWMAPPFSDPTVGAVYSDEDKVDAAGTRRAPFLKPGFSPDLLLTCNYVSHFLVVRHERLRELGGLRSEFDGSQDYDLALRLAERTRWAHVPRVLYHWRTLPGSVAHAASAKPWAYDAARRALEAALGRRGERGRVGPMPWLGGWHVVRELPADWKERIHFQLDEDLEPDPGALEELAAHALRPDVALVTPRVLAWDRTIESAGLALGFGRLGVAACPFKGRDESDPCYFGLARATRDVSAVPAGAFAIERAKLESLGGLPTDVAPIHAGIALALRARARGLRSIFASESLFRRRSTRRLVESLEDATRARSVLGEEIESEPYLSPHFLRRRERLELPVRPSRVW